MLSRSSLLRHLPVHSEVEGHAAVADINRYQRDSRRHSVDGRAAKAHDSSIQWASFAPLVLKSSLSRRLLARSAMELLQVEPDSGAMDAVQMVRERLLDEIDAVDVSERQALVFCGSVICDLRLQGWQIRVAGSDIHIAKPVAAPASENRRKAQVRGTHVLERDAQLNSPSIRAFIREMETRRLHRGEWRSIFSLMRDGPELASQLEKALEHSIGSERDAVLRTCIDPYVQIVEPDKVCEFTGIKLTDLWRYFRHTWITKYNSTPGRQVWLLIRDRAVSCHPVIGIGALGSAIVQITPRDRWVGWTGPEFVEHLRKKASRKWSKWLSSRLEEMIANIYIQDFLKEKVLRRSAIAAPSKAAITALRVLAREARRAHELFPTRDLHKHVRLNGRTDWASRANLHLFRSKRAHALADLLEARLRLQECEFDWSTKRSLERLLDDAEGRAAIETVLRYTKSAHIGVNVMDITVCGALPPYNHILGGKLVAMLMASPEIVRAYKQRYRDAESVIASSIAGRAIRRLPTLVLLGTTSLYDVASSQYNRIRVPAATGSGEDAIEFKKLGRTAGFGSYQFSSQTMQAAELLLARLRRGRTVNSIFGEGVNPKLRKARGALDAVGLSSDSLLKHGSSRIVYGIALASNFRDVLLGVAKRPKYLIPPKPGATAGIAEYWRRRWVAGRIERAEVLNAIRRDSLRFPISHGARVPLPHDPMENGSLFAGVSRR